MNDSRFGLLVSVEGISGVGKTYLTSRLLTRGVDGKTLIAIDEFSRRADANGHDLGRDLLRSLVDSAAGDPFLRTGHPGAETLLFLAIKMFDYERDCLPELERGAVVIEGRSIDSTAVYQSIITHPNDDAAHRHARTILDVASRWRPLPDLTIIITDDVQAAVRRAEERDGRRYTDEHWRLHHRAADLFERLGADDPSRVRTLDRRQMSADAIVEHMAELIESAFCRRADAAGRPSS